MGSSPWLRKVVSLSVQVAGALAAAVLVATPAAAQQTGTLTGVVRDPQGGVLPGVTVTVSGESLIGGSRARA